jgi:hypothetical protein
MDVSASISGDELTQFRMLDRKFRQACRHIRLLNRKIEDLQQRYDQAYSANRRSFRYTYRVQLSVLEGTRNMYYEFAVHKADLLEIMQTRMIQMGLMTDSSESSDSEL